MKKKNIFIRLIDYLWSSFINGLLTILPLTITLSLFNVSFKLLKSWFEPVRTLLPDNIQWVPHAEIILVLITIFLVGSILKLFVLKSLLNGVESLVSRLPLMRTVYAGIKQLVQAFNPQDEVSFKKVVLIEFPLKGVHSIGFLTSELPHSLAPNPKERFYNVFVPTTPNPTTGYFLIVPEKDIRYSELTRQEAMALIISGGIIQPERLVENTADLQKPL